MGVGFAIIIYENANSLFYLEMGIVIIISFHFISYHCLWGEFLGHIFFVDKAFGFFGGGWGVSWSGGQAR